MLPMVAIFAIHIWPVAGGHENTPSMLSMCGCVDVCKSKGFVEETDVVLDGLGMGKHP